VATNNCVLDSNSLSDLPPSGFLGTVFRQARNLVKMEYILHLLIMIAIYTILVVSLDLIAGYTGLLSIAHAAFYGIGAYVTALLSIHFRTQLPLNVMASAIVAAFLGVIFAVPLLRLRDDYFVVATLGFQMILYNIFNNWVGLTGGPLGLPGIPRPFCWVPASTPRRSF